MYSQCPDCQTRFRVNAAHLRAAGGTVRCGRCGAAFDALLTLSDTLLPPAPPIAPAGLGAASGSGAYHFSADDLERVFVDAREWHRQFGKTQPITEPDAVAELTARNRLLESTLPSADDAEIEDVTIEGRTLRIDIGAGIGTESGTFQLPSWAAEFDANDLDSTRPLPVLQNVPEGALFEDDDAAAEIATDASAAAVAPDAMDTRSDDSASDPFGEFTDRPFSEAAVDPFSAPTIEVEYGALAQFPPSSPTVAHIDLPLEPPATDVPTDRELASIFEAAPQASAVEVDVDLEPTLIGAALVDVELETTGSQHRVDHEIDPGGQPTTALDVELANGAAVTPADALETLLLDAEPVEDVSIPQTQPHLDIASMPLGAQRWRTARQYEDHAAPISEDAAPTHSSRGGPWAWAAACAVLALLLVGQIGHQRRNELARDPSLGPTLRALYEQAGIPLSPGWDPTRYKLQQWGSPTDSGSGTLRLRATVTNDASFAQPAPMLRVALEDRFGNPVAVRDFAPAQYLEPTPAGEPMLAPGGKLEVDLMLVDPGADAVGYELKTCVLDRPGQLRCSR